VQFVPTRFHAAIDYLVALTLILAGPVLGYAGGGAETWGAVAAAIVVTVYSLLTNYEWGLLRRIPVPVHLALDLLTGILLAASPWLLGFGDEVRVPHAAAGAVLIAASLTTHPRPFGLEHPAQLLIQRSSS